LRGAAICGRSVIIRAMVLPSMGSTLYFPASTYQVAIISISLSRCSSARSWFSAGSSATWYSSQWWASSSVRSAAVIGVPNGLPGPASAKEGPGQGHTARHPSWSMARWPSISKYWVRCRVGAAGSSKV
jgi:hypothetical protein